MSAQDKFEDIQKLMQEWDDKRRQGMVDIVKVIVSISSVMLTVLATMEAGTQQELSFCEHPYKAMIIVAPYPFLLLCVALCMYHLQYGLNSIYARLIGLPATALEQSEDFEGAWKYLKENKAISHPFIYRKSISIIFILFFLALIFISLKMLTST